MTSANGGRAKRGFSVPPRPDAGAPPAPATELEVSGTSGNAPMSDFASMLASNGGSGTDAPPAVPLGALIAGRPDPERDRVQLNVRQRRDVVQTLDLIARVTRRPREQLVQDALIAHLTAKYADELRAVHHQLYGP